MRGARRLGALLVCILLAAASADVRPRAATAATSVLPRIAFGTGDRALPRIGVAIAATAELLDAPPVLARADAQRYAADALARLTELAPARRERVAALRRALRPQEPGFERGRALAEYAALVKVVLDALPPASRERFLAGELAQAIAYNARVLREANADGYRATLAATAAADAGAPGLAEARAELGKLDARDWSGSARLAERAVAAIVGDPADVPYPSAPSIWTILVRSRAVAGRDAPHVALDVVWFDGHHQTFAALPDGGDFAKNADRLTCVRDREPFDATLHATPLEVSARAGYDALASAFERACDAFDAQPPPYVVADAGDARFVAAALTAAGLDPKRATGVR